ncbi:MAG: alkaline phosphatase D family protein [Xenococcus sp. MO_188.B8]|nr:alkaline phosphatase D family protein [Xenococcus sp. MO_188.B8]
MIQRLSNSLRKPGVHWCWVGAVTDNQVTIKAKIREDIINQYIQIKYNTNSRFFETQDSLNSLRGIQKTSLDGQIATFNLNNLAEDKKYYYVIIAGGRRYPENHGDYLTFKTVKIHKKYNFAIGCSSCAGGHRLDPLLDDGVSNKKIFDVIRKYDTPPLALFIHMGDLHYRNDIVNEETNIDDYRTNYEEVMTQDKQRNLYQNLPLAYIWDDHDYGPNNSDTTHALKYIASKAYREQVPHYYLEEPVDEASKTGAIYQSFVIGRVRFIMTDNRFYKDKLPEENSSIGNSILGTRQKKWFFEQLRQGKVNQNANKERLTIWVNSIPWIAGGEGFETKDAWDRYPVERREIANFIKDNEIDKLLMISGDAHMLAVDDGEEGSANSYAENGGGSFPIIHAASLDSNPSVKGGPYNGAKYIINPNEEDVERGAIKGRKQWGVLHFTDDGNKIEVKVELKKKNKTKIEQVFEF